MGFITPASAKVFAVSGEHAPDSFNLFIITFRRISGIGGKKAILITSSNSDCYIFVLNLITIISAIRFIEIKSSETVFIFSICSSVGYASSEPWKKATTKIIRATETTAIKMFNNTLFITLSLLQTGI
ncbi:MAG: hypothetical protein MJ086_03900 [Lachnospiraceae bacterium]|nr:hypothetical protein [Lachnospiraceae bacterium]